MKKESEAREDSSHSVLRIETGTSPSQLMSEQSKEAILNTSNYERQRVQGKDMLRLKKETNYFNNLECVATTIDNEDSNRNLMKETTNENSSDMSNCDNTCANENDFTQVRKRKRRNCPEKDTENNSNRISTSENLHNENLVLQNKLTKKVECNVDKKAKENNPNRFNFSTKKWHDTPSPSSTDETNTEPLTTGNKKQRKKHGDKKAMNNEHEIKTEGQLKNTNNVIDNLSTNSAKDKTFGEKCPDINHLATYTTRDNTSKDKSPETNALETNDNVHTDINMSPEPLDIRGLLLIGLVSSVLYLIYSTIFLAQSLPTNIVLDGGLDTTVQSVHDRYTQLVQDWEAKVLENAELDYQIALKERSEKLQSARNTTWDSNRGHPDLFVPDCLHGNILTHAFVHLRSYPPDIHDSSSWNKAKLCVDLDHILSLMRSLPFSSVLRFLLFLLSPSNQLNYDTLYAHYVYQQKIHIHNVIENDYPEIYQTNAFYRPDSKLRPSMYCLSLSRFGVLKNKFTPEESDNMLALDKLSDLYVNNDNCLHSIFKGEGSSLDQLYNMILDVLLTRSLSTAITLDPALLHDYYLELILSNETNLMKLSKQLFKYNMLAIDKFNLTISRKQSLNPNEKKSQNGNSQKNEEKFRKFRDGNDEFFVLNRDYINKKEKQDVKRDKHRSLSKTHIELFYDAQLRDKSNGYSSKVAKFLTDINTELKHALCFPYLNDMGDNFQTNDEREPLVRFIKNMCRTNVEPKPEYHEPRARENQKFKDRKYDTQTRVNQEFYDKLDQYNGNRKPYETKQDELVQQEVTIESVDTDRWQFIPNSGREDKMRTFRENMKPAQNIIHTVPLELDNIETSIETTIITPLVNIDPELEELQEGYDEEILTRKGTNDDQEESAFNSDIVYIEESLKNSNIPDLWVLNKMANNFGLVDNVFNEKPARINAYHEQHLDDIEVDDSPTLIQEEIASFLENNRQYKTQFDAFEKENERHKHKDGRKKDKRRDKFGENSNMDNTYHSRSTGESEANAFHTRYNTDKYTKYKHNNHYNSKENADTSYSNYDKDNNKDDRERLHDTVRSNKEERIVHIDGSDNKYTRHVYIDNINAMGDQGPDNGRQVYVDTINVRDQQDPNGRPKSKNKRLKSERGGNSEMDFWSNRRARLRAKLRQKTAYPTQNNPEYHYDYVY
uniref:Uncharacterized protein n=1 Tax=Cacopsylla melanoneura TaxID=428564 RepID=A0A8D8UJW7_9HEMI